MNSSTNSNNLRGPKLMPEELKNHFLDQGLFDYTRPIVLFNQGTVDLYWHAIPADLLAAANESAETIQRAIAPSDYPAVISLALEHRAQFLRGEPILIYPEDYGHLEKRKSGGQASDPLEQAVRRALAATTFAVVERIRHLQAIRDKSKHLTLDGSRYYAVIELIQRWPEDDGLRSADNPKIVKDLPEHYEKGPRHQHIDTLYDKGRRANCWGQIYISSNLKKDLKSWSERFARASEQKINREIAFQKSLVLGLLHCETRAATLRNTLSEISDQVANGGEETPWLRAILSGVAPKHRRLVADVLPAAFAADINPANLFQNLKNARPVFETMRILGRLYRRYPEGEFTPDDQRNIRHAIKLLEQWAVEPWPENDPESTEKAFWAQALGSVMTLDGWRQFFG